MKVKVTHDFFDKENGKRRTKAGETLDVSEERAQQLVSSGVAEPVPEEPEKVKISKDKKQAAE